MLQLVPAGDNASSCSALFYWVNNINYYYFIQHFSKCVPQNTSAISHPPTPPRIGSLGIQLWEVSNMSFLEKIPHTFAIKCLEKTCCTYCLNLTSFAVVPSLLRCQVSPLPFSMNYSISFPLTGWGPKAALVLWDFTYTWYLLIGIKVEYLNQRKLINKLGWKASYSLWRLDRWMLVSWHVAVLPGIYTRGSGSHLWTMCIDK